MGLLRSNLYTVKFTLSKVQFAHMCNIPKYRTFASLQRVPYTLLLSNASACPQPLSTTNLKDVPIVFPFPKCHINGIIHIWSFALLSLSIMLLRFVHVVAYIRSWFLFISECISFEQFKNYPFYLLKVNV